MANHSAALAKHATLTVDEVDTVTLTNQKVTVIEIFNNHASVDMYVTVGTVAAAPANPTVKGDDTILVPAKSFYSYEVPSSYGTNPSNRVVKLIGNANDYAVIGHA